MSKTPTRGTSDVLVYEPGEQGDWLAAAAPGRLLLVHGPGSPLTGLWAGLRVDDGVQGVLDELTGRGVFQTPSFVLLTWTGALSDGPVAVRTIVRGDVTLRLTTGAGLRDVSGRGVSTWVEQSFSAVSAFSLDFSVPGAPIRSGGVSLPLEAGMVWASRVVGTMDGTADGAPENLADLAEAGSAVGPALGPDTPAGGAVAEETLIDVTVVDVPVAVAGLGSPKPPAPGRPAPWTRGSTPSADRPGSPPDSAPVSTPASGYDHLFGATMMRGVEQAAVRVPDADEREPTEPIGTAPVGQAPIGTGPAAPEPLDEGDHDGFTVMSGEVRKLRDSRERVPRPAARPAPVTGIYLLLPNGVHEPLTQPLLFGRSPSVSQVPGAQVPKLVSLGGADQDISRNHARFALEGDTVVVTDLHSRNGTLVVLPGKTPRKLRQGEPTSIIVGTVVDLGGGITITVCED